MHGALGHGQRLCSCLGSAQANQEHDVSSAVVPHLRACSWCLDSLLFQTARA